MLKAITELKNHRVERTRSENDIPLGSAPEIYQFPQI